MLEHPLHLLIGWTARGLPAGACVLKLGCGITGRGTAGLTEPS